MRTAEEMTADYQQFRGRCKELAEAAVLQDPMLKLVRGHYYCYAYGEQPHWWCEKPDGTIVDPSARQFPSNGNGAYAPFNGTIECSNCGKEMQEKDAHFDSNYAFCSGVCNMRFVGL